MQAILEQNIYTPLLFSLFKFVAKGTQIALCVLRDADDRLAAVPGAQSSNRPFRSIDIASDWHGRFFLFGCRIAITFPDERNQSRKRFYETRTTESL